MSIYSAWGFSGNPFSVRPLEPTARGKQLLVGRDLELAALVRRIENWPKVPTVEGGVGSGKTSLVNVASYVLLQRYLDGELETLFLPCRKVFQLAAREDINAFIDSLYVEVAQTLIASADLTSKMQEASKGRKHLETWLNSPLLKQIQGGLSILGSGLNAGQTETLNTSTGFDRSGFRTAVCKWLLEIFPSEKGGVICMIDNMELLQESARAREIVESMRDELFSVHGLRWILCGANGIIQGVVSSPRLQGILNSPITVGGIPDESIETVLVSRLNAFETTPGSGNLPVTKGIFQVLYDALNRNLRSLLSQSDEFCVWVADNGTILQTDSEKETQFFRWFDAETASQAQAAETQVGDRAWQLFDAAVRRGGELAPGAFADYNFASAQAMRAQVKLLEDTGLLQSARDETDQRRRSIQVTPKGFLVAYYRNNKQINR